MSTVAMVRPSNTLGLDWRLSLVACGGCDDLRRHLLCRVGFPFIGNGRTRSCGGALVAAASPSEEGDGTNDDEHGAEAIADAHGAAEGCVLQPLGLLHILVFPHALSRCHDDGRGIARALVNLAEDKLLPIILARHGAKLNPNLWNCLDTHIQPAILAVRTLCPEASEYGVGINVDVQVVLEKHRDCATEYASRRTAGRLQHVDRDFRSDVGVLALG
mmetsp:Transcript_110485/g.319289  ORF Transcript_110485/g.319289 Transcript_110485/m.319289 type:complete len:217 (+) Transcript_110485:315-965(+)